MKIFVTGGTGFIGRRLVDRLAKDKNNQIFCLTRDISKISMSTDENVQYVEGDLRDLEILNKLLNGIDYVYHLAAYLAYGTIDKKMMYDTNVTGAKNVFMAAKNNMVKKVLYVGSAGIYHPTKDKIVDEESQNTNTHTTHYTRTKNQALEVLNNFKNEKHLKIVTLLPVSVYGSGSPMFKPLIDSIKNGEIQLIPTSDCKISMLHVDDLCDCIILAMEKGRSNEKYIVSGESMKLEEITLKISSVLRFKVRIIKIHDWILLPLLYLKDFIDKYIFDTNSINVRFSRFNKELYFFMSGNLVATDIKIRRELGWEPKVTLDMGFTEMVKV